MAKKVHETPAGKLNPAEIRKKLNKKAGRVVAFNLNEENPTTVDEWVETGSRWLDSIICRGKKAGIPAGKFIEIAGLESVGKSYMAAVIAANAQKKDWTVVYFDSESALDDKFLKNAGCNVDELIYVQATSVENVLETTEDLLEGGENKYLFIWDSVAMTPTVSDKEGNFDPLSSISAKARVLGKGLPKLVNGIANSGSIFLCLNQLKTNITSNIAEKLTTPYFTPGGKALAYVYSLRIWLTGRKAKASFILDQNGFRIGSEVKCKIEKSRFGSQGRTCGFSIIWGDDDVHIMDEESWIEAFRTSEHVKPGSRWTLTMADGSEFKFFQKDWMKHMEDPKFKERVIELMDQEVIHKFATKEGKASNFYDLDEDPVQVSEGVAIEEDE